VPRSRLRRPPALGGFGGGQTLQIISEKTPPMSMTQAALLSLSPINGSTKRAGPAGLCFLYRMR